MIAVRLSVKIISILSTMILARLLTPADFGLMALVSSIYALIELLKGFGFDMALIQNQQSDQSHYDTAWTLSIIFSIIASILIWLFGEKISWYYHDSRLESALVIIALLVFIDGFNNIGTVEFRKNLNFQKEFKYQLLIKLSGFFVTIPLAFLLRNYWALLIGMLSNTIVSVFLSYKLQSYRPKFSLRAKNDLIKFCSWLYINNVLQVFNKNSQNFLLARMSGSGSLGIYSLADEVAMITTAEIIAPINRAAYPGYAKLAHDKCNLKLVYLNTLSFISLIALPCAIGVATVSPLIVPLMLGVQWGDTIPIIQLLALSSAIESLCTNSSYIFIVLTKQYLITKLLAVRFLILLPLLFVLSSAKGIQGAAIAMVLTSVIMFPIHFYVVWKVLMVKVDELANMLYRPIIASVAMSLVVNFLMQSQIEKTHLMVVCYLGADVFIGTVCYIFAVFFIWKLAGAGRGAELVIINTILSILNRRRKCHPFS